MSLHCHYCGNDARLVTGAVIYPHRPDLHPLRFWSCAPCDAWVGCHKPGPGHDGTRPLGRLANAGLRRAKKRAHAAFDPLWQSGRLSRAQAYKWLAYALGIHRDDCHIGMFDVPQCLAVIAAVQQHQPEGIAA